jgi:cbb3-type cytochrome oxidase subunit 1
VCSRRRRSTASGCYGKRVAPLVRRYIKTSLVFLVVGLLLGGYLIVAEFVIGRYPARLVITAHVHLLLIGFMLMIVMGVATWMLPKPARDTGRYRVGLAEAVYWVMTVSTAARAVAELTASFVASPGLRLVIAAAGLGQLAGAALFVFNMWSRVRMPATAAPSNR